MTAPENTSLTDLKRGYAEEVDHFTCLCCGTQVEKGIIYPVDGRLYEASRFIRHHIEAEHGSVFDHLLSLDKGATGLTDLQRRLLGLFHAGKSDAEVQKELGLGATSTVRNHRFLLKERERQARHFLALMELLHERDEQPSPAPIKAPKGTPEEPVLRKYFPHGTDGPLLTLSMREKQRLVVLAEVAKRFQRGRRYTEAEVNQLLDPLHPDYVTLRRYLVDYRFLDRVPDGGQYWLHEEEARPVNRRKELQALAKEIKVEAGIFQIKNNVNGKLLLMTTPDLKTINGKWTSLELGTHMNRELQEEFKAFGKEAFSIEVLEVLEQPESGPFDLKDALKKLMSEWMERLQPYGERGYHPAPKA